MFLISRFRFFFISWLLLKYQLRYYSLEPVPEKIWLLNMDCHRNTSQVSFQMSLKAHLKRDLNFHHQGFRFVILMTQRRDCVASMSRAIKISSLLELRHWLVFIDEILSTVTSTRVIMFSSLASRALISAHAGSHDTATEFCWATVIKCSILPTLAFISSSATLARHWPCLKCMLISKHVTVATRTRAAVESIQADDASIKNVMNSLISWCERRWDHQCFFVFRPATCHLRLFSYFFFKFKSVY